MIKVDKIIALLDKNRKLLEKLEGHELAGFAIVVPPEGEGIEVVDIASHADIRAFYESLSNKFKTALEQAQLGGVLMPAGVPGRR